MNRATSSRWARISRVSVSVLHRHFAATHAHFVTPDDGEKLYRDYGILASNLVELGAFAHRADATFARKYTRSIVALAKVVAHYTGKTLDKGKVRSSNWEAVPLSGEQITCGFDVTSVVDHELTV